jgi:hypothetical protein
MSHFARQILRQSLPRIFRLAREQSETCPSCSGSQQIQNERRPSVSSKRGLTYVHKQKQGIGLRRHSIFFHWLIKKQRLIQTGTYKYLGSRKEKFNNFQAQK